MKRAILSIRSRLILEAVTLALKRAGIAVEKTSSQSAPEILLACEAAKAHLLVMDVTRDFMNPSRPTILPTRWTHCKNLKKERKQ